MHVPLHREHQVSSHTPNHYIQYCCHDIFESRLLGGGRYQESANTCAAADTARATDSQKSDIYDFVTRPSINYREGPNLQGIPKVFDGCWDVLHSSKTYVSCQPKHISPPFAANPPNPERFLRATHNPWPTTSRPCHSQPEF